MGDLQSILAELSRNDGGARILVGPSGDIMKLTSSSAALFGYTSRELVHRHVTTLIPRRFHSDHDALHHAFLAAPAERPMGKGRNLYGLRKDGTEIEVEIGLNPITTDAGVFTLVTLRRLDEESRRSSVAQKARRLYGKRIQFRLRNGEIGEGRVMSNTSVSLVLYQGASSSAAAHKIRILLLADIAHLITLFELPARARFAA